MKVFHIYKSVYVYKKNIHAASVTVMKTEAYIILLKNFYELLHIYLRDY